ncbi:hypothetical protein KAR48_08250 [bacterium]|nr:hypothetical protein [bacterium]
MKKLISKTCLIIILCIIACSPKKSIEYIPIEQDFPDATGNIPFAGVRSSSYGISPFPNAQGWEIAITTMSGYFTESIPCAIWIVGEMASSTDCRLFFPGDAANHEHIVFTDTDRHEPYLDYFDQAGIKVFLQVEPANANITELINLVLNRYKHHSCVIGFGIDVEWHREAERAGWGIPATDAMAQSWNEAVKAHNAHYTTFLKHWDREWMPPTYRSDLIFISDSQGLGTFNAMANEFVNYWAAYFKPNHVGFQVGYGADRPWWEALDTPPKDIGGALADRIDQPCSIFWVDFTLREVLPTSN